MTYCDYEQCVLAYDTVPSGRSVPTFQISLLSTDYLMQTGSSKMPQSFYQSTQRHIPDRQ